MHTMFPRVMGLFAIVFLAATPSLAAGGSKTAFREERAVLSFTSASPLVCDDGSSSSLTRDVFVIATERKLRVPLRGLRSVGERRSTLEARAEIVQQNGCTGEMLEAFPSVPEPDAELSGVDSATLDVRFELIEFSTGEPLGFLDVTLDFDGTGDVTRRFEGATTCTDGLTNRTRSHIETRQANVEGMVSLNGTDLLAGVERFAQLDDTSTTEASAQRARCACPGGGRVDPEFNEDDAELGRFTPSVTRTSLDVESANASLRNVAPSVCADGTAGTLETSVFIAASAQVFVDNSTPSESSEASAFLTLFDSCTGETVVGFAPVVEPDYDQLGTSSATLDVSFELSDPGTGDFVGVLDTALVFTGTGNPSCSRSFSVTKTRELIVVTRSRRESRAAGLIGTASFDGLELVDGVDFADLTTSSDTTLFIER